MLQSGHGRGNLCGRGTLMTTLFLIVCAISVVFFVVFLAQCWRPKRKLSLPAARKIKEPRHVVPTMAYEGLGRRSFAYLEEQMAEFLATHTRSAAVLLVAIVSLPCFLSAQAQSGSTSSQASDQQTISPAVAEQLDAMRRRIDELE